MKTTTVLSMALVSVSCYAAPLHTGDAANPAQEAETLRASLAIRANAAPVSPAAPEVAAQELGHARWQHVKLPKSRSASRGMASQPIDVQT